MSDTVTSRISLARAQSLEHTQQQGRLEAQGEEESVGSGRHLILSVTGKQMLSVVGIRIEASKSALGQTALGKKFMKEPMSKPGVSRPWLWAPSILGPVFTWPMGKNGFCIFRGMYFLRR